MPLEEMVQIVTIAGAVATAFSFLVLKPLNAAIARLEKAIETLDRQLERADERRHELELKVAEIDQRSKSAHKRLDTFAEFCHRAHGEMPPEVYHKIGRDKGDDE